ncbi:DNA sulfur modification protein DndD [Psychromonas sp. MME2]|uniref:DNA sulfur modification protein DndD n=1 Tax=Psychromonas sp. MME2 TaxID=3231033 RepID=UPI00339BA5D0
MIIKSLIVNNFRVFRGVHEIDLAPRTEKKIESAKPIILFGGLNGAGKTSILSAVRVALYGRIAFGRGLSTPEYQKELDALIHRGVGVSDNKSSIELVFNHSHNGIESEYKVTRAWERGKRDKLTLEQNSKELTQLNYDQCQSFLTELIPTGIADLFFFDGEKIAELAEDESGQVLQTAVRRLLGIDVVERLRSDLAIYLKRHHAAAMPANIQTQIAKLDKARLNAEHEAVELTNQASLSRAKIDLVAKEIDNAESELSSRGGAWASSREQEKAKQLTLDAERKQLEKTVRSEIEGDLPFSFAPKTLQKLLTQLNEEKATKQANSFNKELTAFMTELTWKLNAEMSDATTAIETIGKCLHDRESNQHNTEIKLDISDRELSQIEAQINVQSPVSFNRFDKARQRLAEVEEDIAALSVNIARAPEQEQLEIQLNNVKALTSKRTKAILEHKEKTEAAKRKYREAIELARKIQKLHDKHKVAFNAEASLSNAQNAHIMLADFSEKLTAVRVKQLEAEFIKSYQKLARKDDLKLSARINTTTFDVELIDDKKHAISRKALSAGEKQIYAISILEALGKTSGKKLPIIIDTPLGRLDSKHRDKLIEHYFPEASHQVIILSTDTEIDESYFNNTLFKNEISHAFEIQFDGATKSSSLKEGYFWEQKSKAALEVN